MKILIAIFCLVFAGLAFAETPAICPPNDTGCFLCGGKGGIPCTTNCTGAYVEGLGYVSCECPQGKGCICHCPVGGGSAVYGQQGEGDAYQEYMRGWVADFKGGVQVKAAGGDWVDVTRVVPIAKGDSIRVLNGGQATIELVDGTKIKLDEETMLNMKELEPQREKSTLAIIIELTKGILFTKVTERDGTVFDINTATNVIGVQGTTLVVSYDDAKNEATVKTIEGTVTTRDNFGHSISLTDGQMVTVSGTSGFGEVESFDVQAEREKWGETGGSCSGSFILPLLLGAVLLLRRS